MNKTIFITGSAGFIGYNIARKLLDQGHAVIGLDNHNADYDPQIKIDRTEDLKKFPKFIFLKKDLVHDDVLPMVNPKKIDYFVHLAANDLYYGKIDNFDYSPFVETNVLGTVKMFKLAKDLQAKKFIFASTHSVYGKTKGIVTEKKILPLPVSPHGASKLAAEEVVRFLSETYKLPAVNLRIFSVYGPNMTPHMFIPKVISAIDSGKAFDTFANIKNTSRDFVYIDDVVEYFISSLDKRIKFQAINIASGVSTPFTEVISSISKIMNKPSSKILNLPLNDAYNDFTIKGIAADISRAKKILHYTPKTNLSEGLEQTIQYFQMKNK